MLGPVGGIVHFAVNTLLDLRQHLFGRDAVVEDVLAVLGHWLFGAPLFDLFFVGRSIRRGMRRR